jgi:hypothetical protein
LVAQRIVRRAGLARGAMEGLRHPARPHVQAKPFAQQRRNLAVRQSELFVQQHDQRDGVRPQMRARRAERIRGLQGVAPLHASTTAAAPAHMHIEATYLRPHDRQIFLNLCGDARFDQSTAAVGTLIGQRDVKALVDHGGRPSMSMSAVPVTRSTARPTRTRRRRPFREGRGLTLARAARRLQRLCQSLNLSPQPIALPLQPSVFVAKSFAFISRVLDLTAQPLELSLRVLDRFRLVASRHARVMADSRKKYKSKIWISFVHPLTTYSVSRPVGAQRRRRRFRSSWRMRASRT